MMVSVQPEWNRLHTLRVCAPNCMLNDGVWTDLVTNSIVDEWGVHIHRRLCVPGTTMLTVRPKPPVFLCNERYDRIGEVFRTLDPTAGPFWDYGCF
jgi:hypothetical protein